MSTAIAIEEHVPEQARIAIEVLGTMGDIAAWETDTAPGGELATAAIYFTEPWKGAMILECALPLAFVFTERMMQVTPPTEVDADVCDALAELVNMIAGNFKALLPPETGISIPSVVRGRDYLLRLRGSRTISRICFGTEFGGFVLLLVGIPSG